MDYQENASVPNDRKARIYTCLPAEASLSIAKCYHEPVFWGLGGNVLMCSSSSFSFCHWLLHCSKSQGFATREPSWTEMKLQGEHPITNAQ